MDKSVHLMSILQLRITSHCDQSNKCILIYCLHHLPMYINFVAMQFKNWKWLIFSFKIFDPQIITFYASLYENFSFMFSCKKFWESYFTFYCFIICVKSINNHFTFHGQIKIRVTLISDTFDCLQQSLKRFLHPTIHPSFQEHTFFGFKTYPTF